MYLECESELNRNEKRRDTEFLLDRYGKVHKYEGDLNKTIISFHYEIAKNLYPDVPRADDYLRKLGWILVGSVVYNCPICDRCPTQSQLNTLYRLGLLSKLIVSDGQYYLNYLREYNK